MSKLLNFLLGRFGKGAGPPISTEKSVKRYDASYIHYCTELEQTLSALESYLHACDDPKEIAMQTLKSACTFYGGDWSGLLEIDLDLDIWTPVWWYKLQKTLEVAHRPRFEEERSRSDGAGEPLYDEQTHPWRQCHHRCAGAYL